MRHNKAKTTNKEWATVTTGNTDLDSLIFGNGIPIGHAILIEKEAGTQSGILSLFFLAKNLGKNIKTAYFTTDKEPDFLLKRCEEDFNLSIQKHLGAENKNFALIDGFYGGHLRGETIPKDEVYAIKDLRSVEEIHDVLREVMLSWGHYSKETYVDLKTVKAVWVYDSISTLIHYGGKNALTLIGHQMAAQKKHMYTGYFIVEKKSLPENVIHMLELWADGIIRFSIDRETAENGEPKRFIEIVKMRWRNHYRGKVWYNVTQDGIVIKKDTDTENWINSNSQS